MPPLVIEYVLEGHQRGYGYTSPTSGYSDDELKLIWRSAMPRGQGWSQYEGARSLKCFPVGDRRSVAVCETVVTDQHDEHGRGGIRRSVIDVLGHWDYLAYLDQRLLAMPERLRARVDRLPTLKQRLAITNSLMTHRSDRLVLLHPYRGAEDWHLMEGLLIKLILSPPGALKTRSELLAFTTLALSPHDESPLVALPADKAAMLDRKTPAVHIY